MIHTFTEEYSWLSNMAFVDIELDGVVYPSVEHAYMSQKSYDEKWREVCRNRNLHGTQVKKLSKNIQLRPDWDRVKLLVMELCIRQKFKQEPFRSKLIQTGKQNIQEGNFWQDEYWGINLKTTPNRGENHLGRIIMKIRDEL